MDKKETSFAGKVTPVLVVIVVGLAFITGSLWQKVNSLSTGGTTTGTLANDQAAQPQSAYSQLSDDEAKQFAEVSSMTLSSSSKPDFSQMHVRGAQDAKVFLVEYSDLQCPYCSAFHQTANQLMDEYEGQVAWVYKHFPLDTIHPKARPAALGAECVASLGGNDAFWKFTDAVFADQTKTLDDLSSVATSLGIDKGAYDTCVSSGTMAQKVDDDYQEGLDAGVTGTPGNFLINQDGKVWSIYGAVPYATLKEAVDQALSS